MASVHKRNGSKYFHGAWRTSEKKLRLRSTKQTDHNKAMAVVLEWERAERMAETGTLTEVQAREVLNDILKRTESESLKIVSIETHCRDWIKSKEVGKAAQTATKYRIVIDKFLTELDSLKTKPITALTNRNVEKFVAARKESGLALTTIQQDIKILRSCLRSACKNGLITHNPADMVELPKADSVERGTFTAEEVKMLVKEASGEWKSLIQLAYFTGARMGDCIKMVWTGTRRSRQQHEGVDFNKETLTYWTTKVSKLITVPIHRELLKHLEKLASTDSTNPYVMPEMASKGPGGRHGLSEGFKRIVLKAGLDLEVTEGSGKRNICRRTFHALRHSFTSALANAGVPPEVRMKLVGHASEAVHKGYTHHELETLRVALNKLPGLKGS